MTRIAYVNGRYIDIREPAVRVEDRGYQFADGVYEVIKVIDGQICDLDRHLERLGRSLGQLRISLPFSSAAVEQILQETYRRNKIRDAILYLQISRGVAPRNHVPKMGRPSIVITCRPAPFPSEKEQNEGVSVITMPDERWHRCDIKSISLLPNILAKQQAAQASCREAWLYDDKGRVTEGCSSNAYIVDFEGRLVTHPLNRKILGGVTRTKVLELASEAGIEINERPFSVDEAHQAREAFLTSTTSLVLPVTSIDGRPVANGHPGTTTMMLAELYMQAQNLTSKAKISAH